MYRFIAFMAMLVAFAASSFAQTTTFPTGSYIINMGVVPQTVNNALKPYGLIYDLWLNNQIPVNWVISPTKAKDGIDFTYNGVAYKGGTFIVAKGFITSAVTAKFNSYGVTYAVTTSSLTVNVTHVLTAAPKWTLDAQNGKIAAGWFPNAGIPSSAYNWKSPQSLTGCDDIFVMPHADPTWSTHSNLYNWNRTQFGAIWAGCHAVSVLENMNNGTLQTNFLANNVGSIGNALVPFGSHAAASPPYIHQYPNAVGAQYMGITDGAHTNGSEQVFLPKKGGSWRSTTEIIAYDATQTNVPSLSSGEAAIIAWGRGFGLSTSGWVMYEAGHDIGKATGAENIAAQRAFWDFSLISSVDKVPRTTNTSVTGTMVVNTGYNLSVTAVSNGGYSLSYLWKATLNGSPAGSFTSTTSSSTKFTPTTAGNYVITCLVSDPCNRTTFSSTTVTVTNGPQKPTLVADVASIVLTCGSGTVSKNVLTNDSDPNGGTITLSKAPLLLAPVKGTVNSWTAAGVITFTSNANVTGTQVIRYYAINTAGLTDSSTLTITIGGGTAPTPVNDAFTIAEDTIGRFNVVSNDGSGVTVTEITDYPNWGYASLGPDQRITYIPNVDYAGNDTLFYKVTNTSGNTATARVVITMTNNSCKGGQYRTSGGTASGVGTLYPTKDAGIAQKTSDSSKNYGITTEFGFNNSTTEARRILLEFNVGSLSIPSDATVDSAVLRMTRSSGNNDALRIRAHRLTQSWNEGSGDGSANSGTINGVSWRKRTFATGWTTHGGSYSNSDTVGSSIIVRNTTGGKNGGPKYDWNVRNIVQNWVTTPANNFGFLMKYENESGSAANKSFLLRENGGASTTDDPVLRIKYTYSTATCATIPNRAPLCNPNSATTVNGVAVQIPTAGNDYFITAGTKTYAILQQPGNGSATINSSGVITYTPSGTFNGTTTMRYTVSVNGLLDTALVSCTVTNSPIVAVNDAPAAANSGVVQTISVKSNDTDLEGQVANATVTISTAPKNGTATVNGSGQVVYTPGTGFAGKDTLFYTLCEPAPGCGDPFCSTARVVLTVTNLPPVAPTVNQSFSACTGRSLNLLSFVSDPEGGILTVTAVSALSTPAAGILTNNGDGTVTFEPAGSVSYPVNAYFTFDVTDNGAPPVVVKDTVFITINNSVNSAPIAEIDRPDSFYFDELLFYSVLDNDFDPDGGDLGLPTITLQPANGSVTVEPSGLIKYTPSGAYVGQDYFIYQICDSAVNSSTCVRSLGLCDTAIVRLKMIQRPIQVSGFVYNDVNGLNGSPSNTIDGTGVGSLTATPLYAYLINASNVVVKVAPVGVNGDFLFYDVVGGGVTYSTRISTVSTTVGQAAPAVTLPSGWVNTGEFNGSGAGNDGTANGILPSITVNTANISTLKLGVEQLPTPADITIATQSNPGGTVQVAAPANAFAGSDPSAGAISGSISSLRITAFPTNTTSIVINGTTYTVAGGGGTTAFPGGGVTVPTNAAGEPTQTITVDPTPTGATSVVISYRVTDVAGFESTTTGTATLPFGTSLSLTGRVFNDIDGISATGVDNLSGLGNPSGATLYANLVNGSNIVVATVAVSINGKYTFPVVTNGTYSVQISQNQGVVSSAAPAIVLPEGWVNTGEKLGTGAGGTDGTPNGILPGIVISGSSVANANFGIEKIPVPTTISETSKVNPGGNTQVAVAATLFGATDEGTGIISSIRITSFPTNATTIVINSTSYTSGTFPGGGVSVPTNAAGQPTQSITIDPLDGAITSVISYKATDNAGKESTVTGAANVPFYTIGISGNVLNDANGLKDNIVNGTGLGNPDGNTLYANLLNGSNVVLATVAVNANGTYSFPTVNPGSYSVQFSTVQGSISSAAPATTLPTNWNFMGEHIGTLSGSDGTPNGTLTGITLVDANINEANTGINKSPTAFDKIYTNLDSANFTGGSGNATYPYGISLTDPTGTADTAVSVTGVSFMPGYLSGTDREDGKFAGSTGGSRATLRLTTLPNSTNGVLVYDSILLVPNPTSNDSSFKYWDSTNSRYNIPNFDNSLLEYFFKFNGQSDFGFAYTFVDAGGSPGNIAVYQAGSNGPLPITLTRFDAIKGDQMNVWLNWETASEINNSHFVVERSGNGFTLWEELGLAPGHGNSTTRQAYQFEDKAPMLGPNFYRLKQVDFDGKFEYSPIRLVSFDKVSGNISVYPNPTNGVVTVSVNNSRNIEGVRIVVSDVAGRIIIDKNYTVGEEGLFMQNIDLSPFDTGFYEVIVYDKDAVSTFKILKK